MRKNETKVNLVFNANSEQPLGKKLLKENKNDTNRLTRLGHCSVIFYANFCVKRKIGRI